MSGYLRTTILLAGLTALFVGVGAAFGGGRGAAIAFLFAAGTNLFAWWRSDRMVLGMHAARPIGPGDAPELFRMTAALSERAGLPMPALYLIHEDQPNAFATGRDPRNAAVAVTTGLLRMMPPQEVAGVVAHELAHIRNRDTLIMTVTACLAGAIGMVVRFGTMFGGGRDNRNPVGPVGALLMIVVAPLAAMLVQMAISRSRESEADRVGAGIAGGPGGLASALRRLEAARHALPPNLAAERNPATAHLFIVNPLSGARMDNLFSTHPSTENRVRALMALPGGAGGGGFGGQGPVEPADSSQGYARPGGRSGAGNPPGPWSQAAPRPGARPWDRAGGPGRGAPGPWG